MHEASLAVTIRRGPGQDSYGEPPALQGGRTGQAGEGCLPRESPLGQLPPWACANPLASTLPAVGVTPPVRIETSSPSVQEGQTVDLNCLVAGRLQPRVRWYKRGGALPAHSQVRGVG